jgi:hypothetical protein
VDSELDDLVKLIGLPAKPVDAVPADSPAWRDVEFRLSLEFPVDYKHLIAKLGTGSFADFLHVLNPFSSNHNLHLERAAHRILGATHEIRRSSPDDIPFAIFPETCGLFPWAITDNGDTLFWLTEGPSAWWPIVILQARAPEHEHHMLGASAVLSRFLRGTIVSKILLDPFEGKIPYHRSAPTG